MISKKRQFSNNIKSSICLIHKVYSSLLKKNRKHVASTKTKSEVRGGGRKPWRQKGTGQARSGSTRSPLWVGGGVIFGPKPRVISSKVNKKEKATAISFALFLKRKVLKFVEGNLFEKFVFEKTKNVQLMLESLGISKKEKTLLILPKTSKNARLYIRNIPNVELATIKNLNLKQILNAAKIVVSNESSTAINQIYDKARASN